MRLTAPELQAFEAAQTRNKARAIEVAVTTRENAAYEYDLFVEEQRRLSFEMQALQDAYERISKRKQTDQSLEVSTSGPISLVIDDISPSLHTFITDSLRNFEK